MCREEVQFGLAASISLEPHIVSYLCPHPPELVLVANYTLLGIVAKGKERLTPLAHLQTIHQPCMRTEVVQLGLAVNTPLCYHIVSLALSISASIGASA